MEDKIKIKQFKDSSSNFWINGCKHYAILEDGSVSFICGGFEDEKETEALKAYIKRNKKTYSPRKENTEIFYEKTVKTFIN